MLRVLLVLEDYGEMIFLQILLSKLGFDVGTLKNPKAIADSLIKMRPDVVVLTAKGKRIVGTEISEQIKKILPKTKVMLLALPAVCKRLALGEMSHVDSVLESPVSPPIFVETILRVNGVDPKSALEKYERIKRQIGRANTEASTPSKYEKFLKLDQSPLRTGFSRSQVGDTLKELRADPADATLNAELQAFVKALFRKKA